MVWPQPTALMDPTVDALSWSGVGLLPLIQTTKGSQVRVQKQIAASSLRRFSIFCTKAEPLGGVWTQRLWFLAVLVVEYFTEAEDPNSSSTTAAEPSHPGPQLYVFQLYHPGDIFIYHGL